MPEPANACYVLSCSCRACELSSGSWCRLALGSTVLHAKAPFGARPDTQGDSHMSHVGDSGSLNEFAQRAASGGQEQLSDGRSSSAFQRGQLDFQVCHLCALLSADPTAYLLDALVVCTTRSEDVFMRSLGHWPSQQLTNGIRYLDLMSIAASIVHVSSTSCAGARAERWSCRGSSSIGLRQHSFGRTGSLKSQESFQYDRGAGATIRRR